jgi:hypothetical protein
MSVPTGWVMPSNGPGVVVTTMSEGGPAGLAATGEPVGPGTGMPGVPGIPGMSISRPTLVVPRYGRRILAVMAHPPAAG